MGINKICTMKMVDIVLCGPTVNAVCIFCMCFKRIIHSHSICADLTPKKKIHSSPFSHRRYPGNEMASELPQRTSVGRACVLRT